VKENHRFRRILFLFANAVWASASGGFRIVFDSYFWQKGLIQFSVDYVKSF